MSYTAILTQSNDLTWKGWGCSLAWWANALTLKGYDDLYADLLFTTNDVAVTCGGTTFNVQGLGLKVVRYNVGGGGPGNTWTNPGAKYKDIEGFWPGHPTPVKDPADQSWNWYADSPQRNMVWKARDRGMSELQLFSDSPMWWMTNSLSTHGATTSNAENLKTTHEEVFCHYLAQVTKYFKEKWLLSVGSVEPFNEPSAYWWNLADKSAQEGCTIYRASQKRLIPLLRTKLNEAGLTDVTIAASDENTPEGATETYTSLEPSVQSQVGIVTTHSYYGLGTCCDIPARQELRKAIGNKELWVSEYGDGDETGQWLCTTIITDINFMRPRAWCYWQPIEPIDSGAPYWGLLNADYTSGAPSRINNKFYVFATFTRHIKATMKLWKSNDYNTIVAWDEAKRELVVLTANYGRPKTVAYELKNPANTNPVGMGTEYKIIRTKFDGSERLKDLGTVQLTDKQKTGRWFAVDHPENCVSVMIMHIPG